MHIKRLDPLHMVDKYGCSLLNLSFILPEVLILCEFRRIDHRLDDLTVSLESFEYIQVDIAPIVYVFEVIIHLL